MTIDTDRLRELTAELGFWPATTDEAKSRGTGSTTRTRTTGWPEAISLTAYVAVLNYRMPMTLSPTEKDTGLDGVKTRKQTRR
jgi:hypothetical protein